SSRTNEVPALFVFKKRVFSRQIAIDPLRSAGKLGRPWRGKGACHHPPCRLPQTGKGHSTMKKFNLTLLLAFFASFGALAGSIVLSPERANHAATLMNTGAVLITGGINETATLDSALLYDPNSQNPRK